MGWRLAIAQRYFSFEHLIVLEKDAHGTEMHALTMRKNEEAIMCNCNAFCVPKAQGLSIAPHLTAGRIVQSLSNGVL